MPTTMAGTGRECPDIRVAENAEISVPKLCAKSRKRNAPIGSVSIKAANASGSVMFGTF